MSPSVENPFQLSNQRYAGNIMLDTCVCCLSSLPDLAYAFLSNIMSVTSVWYVGDRYFASPSNS